MIGYGDPKQLREQSEEAVVRQFLTRSAAAAGEAE
jgi:hypothetical protein